VVLSDFVLGVNYFTFGYFLLINGVYLTLYAISFREILAYRWRQDFSDFGELFASDYVPPISMVVPAYNEEATIADSVRSFLALRYPLHEVIVVNDGSKDTTLETLQREFALCASDRSVRPQLETAPVRGVYATPSEHLIVVDKENGGKSDALNAGVCAAQYPLVCCMDADVILNEDSLLRIARPMIESSDVAAVGGIIRVANGCEFEKGLLKEAKLAKAPLPNFQQAEYLRAFLASRTAWSKLNCLLIISGAFGIYRRSDLIFIGGYAHGTVGEDMELITRGHRVLRENDRRYRISFIPDPVAWTEVPDSLRVLRRQRDRWHRGLMDTLVRHRKMLFNPRYGTVGLLAMPYFFLFEFLGAVIEIVGYFAFVIGLLLGVINIQFALAFLLAAVGLGTLLSTAAILLQALCIERPARWRDVGILLAYANLENFGYRQINSFWRVMAIVSFLRKDSDWGAMERKGFSAREERRGDTPEDQDTADTLKTTNRARPPDSG
jgi:cellulose synthase/poly-beta-1,6-N-acetylglucosamine synthase-like glycosyltransferase